MSTDGVGIFYENIKNRKENLRKALGKQLTKSLTVDTGVRQCLLSSVLFLLYRTMHKATKGQKPGIQCRDPELHLLVHM